MTKLIDVITLSKKICRHPIEGELAYATFNNLVGRPIAGYDPAAKNICLLTPKAAKALCEVQNQLAESYSYGLFIYDTYRPTRAVKDFLNWSRQSITETDRQQQKIYYPQLEKNQLFVKGYISENSNHCYGNTVDLVLIDLSNKTFLDMGTIFDYMGEDSHYTATPEKIGQTAHQLRLILRHAMENYGFEPYMQEFWHFSHGGEAGREVDQPLDIPIICDLQNTDYEE